MDHLGRRVQDVVAERSIEPKMSAVSKILSVDQGRLWVERPWTKISKPRTFKFEQVTDWGLRPTRQGEVDS